MNKMSTKGSGSFDEEAMDPIQETSTIQEKEDKIKSFDIRIIVVGLKDSGKTTFVEQAGKRDENGKIVTDVEDADVRITLIDTKDKYGDLVDDYGIYKSAHGVVVVSDVTEKNGCDILLRSFWHVKARNKGKIPMLAIGNKTDLEMYREWKKERAVEDCECADMPYIELSAKTQPDKVHMALRVIAGSAVRWARAHPVAFKTGDPSQDPTFDDKGSDEVSLNEGAGCCVVS